MSFSTLRQHSDPAAEAAVLISRIGLALVGIAVPCAAVGARRAIFVLMPVGAVLILVAALLDTRGEGLVRFREGVLTPAGAAAMLLLLWAVLSLVWTPFRVEAAARFSKEAGTMALALAVCAFLPERTRISNLYLWPLGVGMAATLALITALAGPALLTMAQDGENSTLERGLLGIVALVWPAMAALALRGRWNAAGVLAVMASFAAIAVWSTPGLVALVAGALVFAAAAGKPLAAARVLAGTFAVLLLIAPLLPQGLELIIGRSGADPDTVYGSLQATVRAWGQITRSEGWRLLTGHGIDSVTRGTLGGFLPSRTPHSILFEVWFELGAIGAVTACMLVVQGFLAFGRLGPTLAPFMLAGLSSVLVIGILGFSFSQLWWVTLLGVVAMSASHVIRGQFQVRRPQIEAVRGSVGHAQEA